LADRTLNFTLLNARLDAGLICIAVMLWSRSMLGAMGAGMAAFVLLRACSEEPLAPLSPA